MIYGLWLSATGVQTSSHQVDVIANNLANAETGGFRRQIAEFRERPPEAREPPVPNEPGGDRFFDGIGGGQLLAPSAFDTSQGTLDQTGNNLDCAINGDGYFMVRDATGQDRLTRNGSFALSPGGELVLAVNPASRVLDADRQPIKLGTDVPGHAIAINRDGQLQIGEEVVGRLGVYRVADESKLRPIGGSLLKVPASMELTPGGEGVGQVESGFIERSNVDPAVEITRLMQAQRALEANANMIRYQDQTLGRLVNDIGKV